MKVEFKACFMVIFIAVAGLQGVAPSQGAKLGYQGSLRKSLCAELSQIFAHGLREVYPPSHYLGRTYSLLTRVRLLWAMPCGWRD